MTTAVEKVAEGQYNLGHTQVTEAIRVSSAALEREYPGHHWLVETWCFSDDPRQRSFQIIHGTTGSIEEDHPVVKICHRIHHYVVEGLRKKHIGGASD